MNFFKTITIPSYIKHVKLDIGLSYKAPQSQAWLEKEDDLLVFGFEPNPESVKCILSGGKILPNILRLILGKIVPNILRLFLEKLLKERNPLHNEPLKSKYINTRFFLFPIALSNVKNEEKMDFYITKKDCGTSSLYEPSDPKLGPTKKIIKVSVFSLKHFFDEFPWNRFPYIDYIKIDAQGSDLDILKGAGHYLSERVVYITAEPECKQYKNTKHNNVKVITKYMKRQGFIKVYHRNTNDPTFLNEKFYHLKDIFIKQL